MRKLYLLCAFLFFFSEGICQKSPCVIQLSYPKEYPFLETSLQIFEKKNSKDTLILYKRLFIPEINFTFESYKSYQTSVHSPFFDSVQVTFNADTLHCPLVISLKPKEKTLELKEVVIKAEKERFERQGDTLVIRVKDSDARPHAEANTLFDRIQGLESNGNGSLRVLGKNVQEVTVDGKKIFGGVGSLTLDNIKADMIERMEFIESSPTTHLKQNTLNLVLKPTKKKGIYGNISGGYGNNQNYITNSRFSKIMPKGFVSGFSTANSINERGIDPKTLEEMTVRNYKKTLNRQGSAIGLYETDLTQETQNQLPINQRLQGNNRYADMGFNITHIRSKVEMDGFVVGIANQNYQWQRRTNFSLFNSINQTVETTQNRTERLQHAHAQLNLAWKLNPKTTFQFANQIQINGNQITQRDTIQSFIDSFYSINTATRQLSQTDALFDNILQVSGVHKGKKQGIVSSLYFQMHTSLPSENKIFSNRTDSFSASKQQSQALTKDNSLHYISTQFLHARPLTRRILVEGKLNFTNRQVQIWQQTDQLNLPFPSENSSLVNINQEKIAKIESGLYLFYKRPKTQIISGLGYWKWLVQRDSDGLQFRDSPHFWLNPFTKMNFRLSTSTLAIKFAREPYLPTWQNTLAILDSSEVFNLVRGNFRLQHYRQNSSDLTFTSASKNGYQVNLSINYQQIEQGSIINRNEFNLQTGAFESTFTNAKEPTSVYNAHFTLFRIQPNSRFTWFFLGGLLGVNSLMETQNQLTTLRTRFGFTQLSATLKINSGFQVRANMKSQFSFLENRLQSNHQLILRNNLDLGKKWYIDSHLRFNANVTEQTQVQSFFDAELSRYFLRNNQCKAAIVLKNIFNTPFERTISQTNNSQISNEINYLPFTSVLSFTFYPEKWK